MVRRIRKAFTLVEILIVVVILGILASIVVPQFARAVGESQETSTFDQLSRIRRAVAYYYATNNGTYPDVQPGDGRAGAWGTLVPTYMREAPQNFWIPNDPGRQVIHGTVADTAYQATYGWIYNPATGEVWAGGFDDQDRPLARP